MVRKITKCTIIILLCASMTSNAAPRPSRNIRYAVNGGTGEPRDRQFGNIADAVGFVTDFLRPDRVDLLTSARYNAVKSEVADTLKWSGQPCVALEVEIATADADESHKTLIGDGVTVIGPGTSLVDAIVSGNQRALISAAPPAGYSFSAANSYYVWATSDGGKVRFQPEMAEATGRTNNDVKLELAKREAQTNGIALNQADLAVRLLRHFGAIAATSDLRQRALELQSNLKLTAAKVRDDTILLSNRLDEQRRLAQAQAILGKIQAVLQFASVVANIAAASPDSARANIQAARNPAELKAALDAAVAGSQSAQGALQTELDTYSNSLGVYVDTSKTLLQNGGAPSILTIRLTTITPH